MEQEQISSETDDLIRLVETLKENEAEYDKALQQWNADYRDVLEEEVVAPPILGSSFSSSTGSSGFRRTASENVLGGSRRRRLFSGMKDLSRQHEEIEVDSPRGYFDLSSTSSSRHHHHGDDDLMTSSFSIDTSSFYGDDYCGFEDELTLVEELVENLTKDHQRVGDKFQQMDDLLKLVKNEHEISGRLQDDVASAHRSLTMLELRQEKIIREALYDNVTANTTVRQLQEEVIQLRLREAQNREDLQRLTAENSRLKLKVMDMRKGSLKKPPLPPSGNTKLSKFTSNLAPSSKVIKPKVRAPSPGLMVLDDIVQEDPFQDDLTVVHRGTMGKFHKFNNKSSGDHNNKLDHPNKCTVDGGGFKTFKSSHESTTDISSSVAPRPSTCPLCGHTDDVTEVDDDVTITPERLRHRQGDVINDETSSTSRGTSTREIENIIALRSSVQFLGYNIPIPLFVAMLIRMIDNCLLMIGHICFAEYPPLNFPELRYNAVKVLHEVRERLRASPSVYS